MNIPKKIKIGPHVYRIKFEKGLDKNHSALGQSRHTDTEIVLDPDQSESQLEDSFLHEILHCINAQAGFTDTRNREVAEDCISRLAPMLLSVIKDNTEILKYEKK